MFFEPGRFHHKNPRSYLLSQWSNKTFAGKICERAYQSAGVSLVPSVSSNGHPALGIWMSILIPGSKRMIIWCSESKGAAYPWTRTSVRHGKSGIMDIGVSPYPSSSGAPVLEESDAGCYWTDSWRCMQDRWIMIIIVWGGRWQEFRDLVFSQSPGWKMRVGRVRDLEWEWMLSKFILLLIFIF